MNRWAPASDMASFRERFIADREARAGSIETLRGSETFRDWHSDRLVEHMSTKCAAEWQSWGRRDLSCPVTV